MAENRNPYDALFRGAFSDPETGKELTLFLLPEQHSRRLAGAQVTVEPESLIDLEVRAHYTDLLLRFRRPGGGDAPHSSAYVYVLYEHKSYPYRWVTVQLLRYMTTLWQRLASEPAQHRSGLLPEILPVVVYHGDRAWNRPLQFAELVTDGESADHVPHFEPVFIDLSEIPDNRIRGSLRTVLGILALKHARLHMERSAMELLTELLHRAEHDPAARPLARLVEQVYAQVKSAEEVRQLVAAASRKGYHEVEGGYMTYAQEMRREGLQEGRQQGSLQHSREVLVRQMDRKFGLTDAERKRIMACEEQQAMETALDIILEAETKEQVLAMLS
jgi:predicted transposase/invertase (TIGR01784 family)